MFKFNFLYSWKAWFNCFMNKSNFYYEFENRFRGSRDQVKTSLLGYNNFLNKILHCTNGKPRLLDIGSGRVFILKPGGNKDDFTSNSYNIIDLKSLY